MAQLVATGRVDRAYLGIGGATVDADLARVLRLPVDAGVLFEVVGEGSAAARAGLKGPAHDSSVVGQARATRSAAT